MCSARDQNAVLAVTSPVAAVLEEVAGHFLLDALRLPADASYAFVTGCQMAHTTALAAARHAVLARAGWSAESQGLHGAPAIRVLANAHRHSSIDPSLRLPGLGTDCIVPLGVGGPARVGAEALAVALAEAPGAPTIVVLNAGDLNIGACDDFASLCPVAQAAGAWVHVDGAFGLWANASPRMAPLTSMMELGRHGIAAMIERCCDHAAALYDGFAALPGATGIWRPTMNQGLIRFDDPAGANISDAVIAAINESGEAYLSGGSWDGERVMRISVCGWNTTDADVARAVAAAGAVLG